MSKPSAIEHLRQIINDALDVYEEECQSLGLQGLNVVEPKPSVSAPKNAGPPSIEGYGPRVA